MIKRFQAMFGLLLVVAAAGCQSGSGDVVLLSEAHLKPAANPAATAAPPAAQKLSEAELLQVQVAVCGDLLQRHFWDKGEYAAIFVQGDDAEVAALIKKFPNHVPPIKTSDQAELRPNIAPVDRLTGKPAMVFSVEPLDPVGDTLQAVGRWYAGGAVTGYYTYTLRKVGDEWVVESVK